MFETDYVLRQIQMLAQGIAHIFFHREEVRYDFPEEASRFDETDRWYSEVRRLLEKNRINEAENLLFDHLDPLDRKGLNAALDFYSRLSGPEEKRLSDAGFSLEEIQQGLKDAAAVYGVDLGEI